ncbi:MAG: trypsin-like peptidase domain-containing protein [Chloroflexi bacterium]|nr:trypsin-like peptidase domain-containing protein [Chloroflexota bacterium]
MKRLAAFAALFLGILVLASCSRSPGATPTPTTAATAVSTPAPSPVVTLPSITDVAEKVRPAVVSIVVQTLTTNFFLQPVPEEGAGSGVIFDSKGYILTNNHVVEGARQISVNLSDGRSFDASVVGRDPATDLAVIKISADNLPTAHFGNSDNLRIGDWVIAIGNAFNLPGGPTVTAGVVGALDRSISEPNNVVLNDLIQTDAAINPGNSGGPLVNLAGEVVGINTAIETGGTGIGFAVSTATAQPVLEQLVANGRVIWPWIGIQGQDLNPILADQLKLSVKEGVLVRGVQRAGPADKAGMQAGDVITGFEGTKIADMRQLQDIIRKRKIGDKVNVTFVRNSKEQTVSLTLEEFPRS